MRARVSGSIRQVSNGSKEAVFIVRNLESVRTLHGFPKIVIVNGQGEPVRTRTDPHPENRVPTFPVGPGGRAYFGLLATNYQGRGERPGSSPNGRAVRIFPPHSPPAR